MIFLLKFSSKFLLLQLAAKLPANRVFGTAIAISAALNILLPGSAYIHPGAFVIIRIFQGFAEVN